MVWAGVVGGRISGREVSGDGEVVGEGGGWAGGMNRLGERLGGGVREASDVLAYSIYKPLNHKSAS